MREDIEQVMQSAFMEKEAPLMMHAVESAFFKDHNIQIKAELSRLKEVCAREEEMCSQLDEVLPKLTDLLYSMESDEVTAETI